MSLINNGLHHALNVIIMSSYDGFAEGVINLANCAVDTSKQDALQLIRLSAEDGSEENTIDNTRHINPVNGTIKAGDSNDILFEVPAYSVNIIKIRLK